MFSSERPKPKPGSRAAAEQEARELSQKAGGISFTPGDEFGDTSSSITWPGGKSKEDYMGMNVHKVKSKLEEVNPDFVFKVNNMMEQYPYVFGSKFVRLLYDRDNNLVSISRK